MGRYKRQPAGSSFPLHSKANNLGADRTLFLSVLQTLYFSISLIYWQHWYNFTRNKKLQENFFLSKRILWI
jgi:hypothetical protein